MSITIAAGTDDRLVSVPWVERHRPRHLEDVAEQEHVITTINQFLASPAGISSFPHLLFYGPAGTGKTTTALALAHQLYGDQIGTHVLELNASDECGIQTIRERVKTFTTTRALTIGAAGCAPFKLVILDEADNLSSDAQAALRRVIEKATATSRFILICNYINKIIPAIQSRTSRFRFSPLSQQAAAGVVLKVAQSCGDAVSADAVHAAVTVSDGDLRRAITVFQASSLSAGNPAKVTPELVYQVAAVPSPEKINDLLTAAAAGSVAELALALTTVANDSGASLEDVVAALVRRLPVLDEISDESLAKLLVQVSSVVNALVHEASPKVQAAALAAHIKNAVEGKL